MKTSFLTTCRNCLIALCFVISPVNAAEKTENSKPQFDIWEFQVEKNSVLNSATIENILTPFLGPGRTIDDVEQARKALEQYYRNAGFPTALVDIPPQQVDEGLVRLRVTEGRLSHVQISESKYYSPDLIRTKLDSLRTGTVPFLPEMQQNLGTVNNSFSDMSLTPVLRQGNHFGELEVELKVSDKLPLHGGVELNDRYGLNTTKYRMSLNLSYSNLWQRNHSLSFFAQTAPENTEEVEVYSLNYSFHLPRSNQLIALYSMRSNSEIAIAEDDSLVIGKGDTYGIKWIVPFANLKSSQHSFTLGAEHKNTADYVGFLSDEHRALFEDINTPISYSAFSINYAWNQIGENYQWQFQFGPSFSFRGLSDEGTVCKYRDPEKNILEDDSVDEFGCRRVNAKANFIYLNSSLSLKHNLPFGGAIQFSADGQFTDQPLISGEQYAIGGVNSVRGYPESQALGDYGARSSLEIMSPNLPVPYVQKAFLVVFVDAAAIFLRDPLPEQDRREGLASWGVGGNLLVVNSLRAALDFAWPQRKSSNTDINEWRSHFSVAYDF